MTRAYLFFLFLYFIILYVLALRANWEWRSEDDILWINNQQWGAIFWMILPVFIGGFIK